MPLVVSYAMLTGNVVASAPAVRRQFSKVRHGSLYFNAGLATLTFGMCASIFPSAFQVGDALKRVSASYAEIMQIMEQGSVSENLAMLMEIAEPLALIGEIRSSFQRKKRAPEPTTFSPSTRPSGFGQLKCNPARQHYLHHIHLFLLDSRCLTWLAARAICY